MACPQCELGGLRCDDAMLSVRYHELATPEKAASSRKGPYAFHETGTYDRSMSHARAWEIVAQAITLFRVV